MSKVGIVYAKEVPMIKVKQVKEINGKGTPLHTVIQYWTSCRFGNDSNRHCAGAREEHRYLAVTDTSGRSHTGVHRHA